eukprot:SAG22_NODE_1480_length_4326_cov_32.114739_2_plen_140_part_00
MESVAVFDGTGRPRILIVAARPIKPYDELLTDYGEGFWVNAARDLKFAAAITAGTERAAAAEARTAAAEQQALQAEAAQAARADAHDRWAAESARWKQRALTAEAALLAAKGGSLPEEAAATPANATDGESSSCRGISI